MNTLLCISNIALKHRPLIYAVALVNHLITPSINGKQSYLAASL
jgi:hypothetical protein